MEGPGWDVVLPVLPFFPQEWAHGSEHGACATHVATPRWVRTQGSEGTRPASMRRFPTRSPLQELAPGIVNTRSTRTSQPCSSQLYTLAHHHTHC